MSRGLRAWIRDLADSCLGRSGLDPASLDFIRFCRNRWPKTAGSSQPLILLHHSVFNATILSYAFIANWFARHHGAQLASFGFDRSGRPLGKLYASFGASPIFGPKQLELWKDAAEPLAAEIFSGLRSKRDVVNIRFEGISLGDLIYDSYLRYHLQPTADLADPRLRETIRLALQMFFAARELLVTREVAAVFSDHAVYLDAGMLSRLAIAKGIPVYHVTYNPATLIQLDPKTFEGTEEDPRGRPSGTGSCKLILPYHRFAEIFRALPSPTQAAGLKKARASLEARLAGKFDPGVLPGGSAYRQSSGARILEETGRPRVLVMLHDFCDAPHAFRDLLFPDHYEWACWLMERASKTDFDWYVKPHPNTAHDQGKDKVNHLLLAELKTRFPKMRFLAGDVSNLQLISEGLSAMFTGYGTAGHEFAYLGVPAVNAGDNPHINYTFTYHPQSIEELGALIVKAAELVLPPDHKAQIEEFACMRFVHYIDREAHPVSVLPAGFEESPETFRRVASSEVLRFVAEGTDAREAAFDSYLKRLLPPGAPSPP